MPEKIDLALFTKVIKNIYDTISENKMYLSELDSVIGDGDHGPSLTKGLKSAVEAIEKKQPSNITDLLKTAGNAITITIGGVTGPIFGMFFSEMGKTIDSSKEYVEVDDLKAMFSSSLGKIMKIGGAKPGDKTMVDALSPAVEALKTYIGTDIKLALEAMVEAAKKGASSTKDMVASKGRARYSGERSLGHEDAGANSICFMLKAFHDSL
jgi:dihydroxyacetone kinase-like protein